MLDGTGCLRHTQHIMGTLGKLAVMPPLRKMHLLRETTFLGRPEGTLPAPGVDTCSGVEKVLVSGERGALHTCRLLGPISPGGNGLCRLSRWQLRVGGIQRQEEGM